MENDNENVQDSMHDGLWEILTLIHPHQADLLYNKYLKRYPTPDTKSNGEYSIQYLFKWATRSAQEFNLVIGFLFEELTNVPFDLRRELELKYQEFAKRQTAMLTDEKNEIDKRVQERSFPNRDRKRVLAHLRLDLLDFPPEHTGHVSSQTIPPRNVPVASASRDIIDLTD